MSITDPVSDMLTRIRNAYATEKNSVFLHSSKLKEAVLAILKDNGYIKDFKNDGKTITVYLKYDDGKPAISGIERISKPSRRVYVKKERIPVIFSGQGIVIISTSKGVLTGEKAKDKNLGGELIAKVY